MLGTKHITPGAAKVAPRVELKASETYEVLANALVALRQEVNGVLLIAFLYEVVIGIELRQFEEGDAATGERVKAQACCIAGITPHLLGILVKISAFGSIVSLRLCWSTYCDKQKEKTPSDCLA